MDKVEEQRRGWATGKAYEEIACSLQDRTKRNSSGARRWIDLGRINGGLEGSPELVTQLSQETGSKGCLMNYVRRLAKFTPAINRVPDYNAPRNICVSAADAGRVPIMFWLS